MNWSFRKLEGRILVEDEISISESIKFPIPVYSFSLPNENSWNFRLAEKSESFSGTRKKS